MKIVSVLLPLALLAACSSPDTASQTTGVTPAPDAAPAEPTPTPAPAVGAPAVEPASSASASASGVVESVDAAAKTVTIAHEAVKSLEWPAMTMTFQAPTVDLGTIKQGDKVSFEFTAVDMDGTITSITRK